MFLPEYSFIDILSQYPLWLQILLIALIPASLTSLGTLPVLLGGRIGEKFLDMGLGFSAGIMLVASFTSLLIPAMETGRYVEVYLGLVTGIISIYLLDKSIPHLHIVKGYEGPASMKRIIKRTLLISLAIIIHNIPEGMSVGVSTIYSLTDGLIIAVAIGIQDIPEGLAVSLPVYHATRSPVKAISIGVLSGVSELAAACIPLGIIMVAPGLIDGLLPFLMCFSAGAMIYVVAHEIIPEIYGHGHDEASSLGFFAGFLIMLFLDTMLG